MDTTPIESRPIGRDVLGCVVTGYEHGGTTLVKDLVLQATGMASGFEGGLLLRDSPAEGVPEPHLDLLLKGWMLPEDFPDRYRACPTLEAGYRLLRELSPKVVDKGQPRVDKTPRYMAVMADVLQRSPGTPLVLVIRDPVDVIASRIARGAPLPRAVRHVVSSTQALLRVAAGGPPVSPIRVVRFADVLADPEAALAEVAGWLGVVNRAIDHSRKMGTAGGPGRQRPHGVDRTRGDIAGRTGAESLAEIHRAVAAALPDLEELQALPSAPWEDIASRLAGMAERSGIGPRAGEAE